MLMKHIIIPLALCCSLIMSGQHHWKRFRKEITFNAGAASFLGDLGGGANSGTPHGPADLNLSQTRSSMGLGFSYKLQSWLNVTQKLSYLVLKGDDAETKNTYRNNRNLNFRTHVFELSTRLEIGLTRGKFGKNSYSIRKSFAGKRLYHSIYGFCGVGLFYFNPKAKLANGEYVALRPLHTEGQGLDGGPKQYSRINLCIPVGFFYKLTINQQWTAGVEFAWRKTFTDYIDDVGSRYYNKELLKENYGLMSAQLSDPGLGNIEGAALPSADGTAAKRGNARRDSYLTIEIRVGYVIEKKRKQGKLRSKF